MVKIPAHFDIAPGQCCIDEDLGSIAQDSDVATLAGFDELLWQSVIVLRFSGDRVLVEFYLLRVPANDPDFFQVESSCIVNL